MLLLNKKRIILFILFVFFAIIIYFYYNDIEKKSLTKEVANIELNNIKRVILDARARHSR